MMAHEILMSVESGLLRVAQIEDGVLVSMQAAPLGKAETETSLVGQIYLARVERVVERLQAAFVDIGFDKSAFLGAREARALLPEATRDTPIEDCVEDGDTVLVQVTRPPQGDKGAQVTADVTLAGRGVVLAPCRSRIAVSRQIEDETERTRLTELAEKIRADAVDVDVAWTGRRDGCCAPRRRDKILMRWPLIWPMWGHNGKRFWNAPKMPSHPVLFMKIWGRWKKRCAI